MAHNYPLLHELSKQEITGIAVQWGNYEAVNPNTKRRVTVSELIDFATGYLGASYMFWCIQEPYYSRDVLPALR